MNRIGLENLVKKKEIKGSTTELSQRGRAATKVNNEALSHSSYDVSCQTYKNEQEKALAKVYREVSV